MKAAGGRPDVATSALSMLKLGDVDEPELPTPEWVRVLPTLSGICGSDLAAIGGHASLYLDPLTSYPFVPGHEVVGTLEDGTRVVIEQTRVNDEVWLPRHLAFKFNARVALFKGYNVDGEQSYRDYKKFRSSAKIVGVGEVKQ